MRTTIVKLRDGWVVLDNIGVQLFGPASKDTCKKWIRSREAKVLRSCHMKVAQSKAADLRRAKKYKHLRVYECDVCHMWHTTKKLKPYSRKPDSI